jgi:hypothetical protein
MIIFAAQSILRRSRSKLGYLLLRCAHHYVDFNMYAKLEVHTEDTITAGRAALRKFSDLMEVSGPHSDMINFILTSDRFISRSHRVYQTRIGTFRRNI